MNFWLYTFIISLIVFLLLIEWKTIHENLWAGFICFAHQLVIHLLADKLDYWYYIKVDYGMPDSIIFSNSLNIFFLFIAFGMGILFVQFLPQNLLLQLIHAYLWTFFFRLTYYLAEQNGLIVFIHWKAWMYYYLIPVNFIALAWISNIIKEGNDIVTNEYDSRNST